MTRGEEPAILDLETMPLGEALDRIVGLDPKARGALHKALRLRQKEEEGARFSSALGSAAAIDAAYRRRCRLEVLLFATGTLSEVKKLGHRAVPEAEDAVVAIRALAPPWAGEWAEDLLAKNPRHFPLVLRLVREGLVAKPAGDAWILGLYAASQATRFGGGSVREWLASEPGFLEEEVWRVFEVEGGGEFSLAATDKYRPEGSGWDPGLAELAASGHLARDRLLDATLAALGRDFAAFRAGWYVRFHARLAPSRHEIEVRRERYLSLLGSRVETTMGLAVDALASLGPLPLGELSGYLAPALSAKGKGLVLSALALVRTALEADPSGLPEAARLALPALGQGSPEVARAVLAILERLDAGARLDLGPALSPWIEAVPASLRARFRKLLPDQAGGRGECGKGAAPEVERVDPAPRSPGTPGPVAALPDAEAVLTAFLEVLEHPEQTVTVARVLRGLEVHGARFAGDATGRLAPLARRAAKLLGKRELGSVRRSLARLALGWAGLPVPAGEEGLLGIEAWFQARIEERIAAGFSGAMGLAAGTLAELLEAPRAVRPNSGDESGPAFPWRIEVRESQEFTFRRLRVEVAPDPAGPGRPSGSGLADLLRARPPSRWWHEVPTLAGRDLAAVRLAARLFRSDREAFYAEAAERLDPDWTEARWEVVGFLEPLAEETGPLRPMEALLLALGLSAKEPGQAAAARDAWLARVERGNLEATRLAEPMTRLLVGGVAKASRLAKNLGEVAAAGAGSRAGVLALLSALVEAEGAVLSVHDAGKLAALWHELLCEAGVPLPEGECRRRLAGFAATGRLAGAIRGILASGRC